MVRGVWKRSGVVAAHLRVHGGAVCDVDVPAYLAAIPAHLERSSSANRQTAGAGMSRRARPAPVEQHLIERGADHGEKYCRRPARARRREARIE